MGKTIGEIIESLPKDRQKEINQHAKELIDEETCRGNLLSEKNIERLCGIIVKLFKKKNGKDVSQDFDISVDDENLIFDYTDIFFDEYDNCEVMDRITFISFDDIRKEFIADLNRELDEYWKDKR